MTNLSPIPKAARFVTSILAILLIVCTIATSGASEAEIRETLYSAPDTYGWISDDQSMSYDFFKDGRLHVQGPDGEATMWEGTWKLKGDQLTLVIPELKTNKTFTVKFVDGELYLGEDRYKRYAP